METDPQRRFLTADFNGVHIVNCYVPNGSEVGDPKYDYKLKWLDCLEHYISKATKQYDKLVLLGDFNIAPTDADVWDPAEWQDKILCSKPERQALEKIQSHQLTDLYRQFSQENEQFSWWDYRAGGFQRNNGLRIDLILTSPAMSACAEDCTIEKAPRGWERPSDHTPVIASFAL